MLRSIFAQFALLALCPVTPSFASEISTHVLDLARGVGGAGIPATLERKDEDGTWRRIATAQTDANGRIRSFGEGLTTPPGTYRISFDMTRYGDGKAAPFFPEISVVFRASDDKAHYHVPVVVSPFGYSSYRGN